MMERFLAQYLVNSIWQVPLLLAGTWLALRAARPRPITQHRIWIAALLLMLTTPLLSLRTESFASPEAPTPTVTTPLVSTASTLYDSPVSLPPQATSPTDTPVEAFNPPQSNPPTRPLTHSFTLTPAATRWLIALYLAITAWIAVRLLVGSWLALRIVRAATPATLSPSSSALLHQCCQRLGVAPPDVLVSPRTTTPMLVGIMRPSLLLPQNFASRIADPTAPPDRELEAVWLHELAHLCRHDHLSNLACRIAALPIAYHPATFAVQQRIRQTREIVCDSVAAAAMQSQVAYAQCLVSLARNMQGATPALEGVGILSAGTLEERIMQLVKQQSSMNPRTRIARLAAGATVMLSVLALAATFHLTPTLAQTAIAPAAATAPVAPSAPATEISAPAAAPASPVATRPPVQPRPAAPAKPAVSATPAAAAAEPAPPVQSAATRADLGRQLAEARARLNADTETYESLLAQRDQALGHQDVQAVEQGLLQQKHLTDQQSQELARNMAALDQKLGQQAANLNSPEFKKHMADLQAQLNSPEFKLKMDNMAKQMAQVQAKLNSPDFKKQMADAQAKVNSPEFKKQIADAQAKINSPEFKAQLDGLAKQMAKAQAQLDSPEFKERMKELSKQMADAQANLNNVQVEALAEREYQSILFSSQLEDVRRQIEDALRLWDEYEGTSSK